MVMSINQDVYATPSWLEADIIMDNDHDESNDGVDATTRGAFPFKEYIPGLVDLSEEFSVMYKAGDGDEVFGQLETAKRARTSLDISISDYIMSTTGAKYVRGIFMISTFKRGEQIGDACKVTVKLQPSAINGGNHPIYGVVGS